MSEHAGMGCILSVLIIVAFTLIFHEVDRPAPPTVAVAPVQPRPMATPIPGPNTTPIAPAPAAPGSHPTVVTGPVSTPPTRPIPPAAPPATPIVAASTVTLIGLSRPVASGANIAPADRPTPEPGHREIAAASSRPVAPGPPRPAQPHAQPRRPASSATIVQDGERLADVALRVYGTPDAAARLWQANRDRLRGVDTPVPAGLLIRTP